MRMVVLNGKPRRLDPVDEEAVRIIDLTIMCQTFNCLPRVGGIFDQDAYTMECMKVVLEAQGKRAELDQKKAEAEAKAKANAARH